MADIKQLGNGNETGTSVGTAGTLISTGSKLASGRGSFSCGSSSIAGTTEALNIVSIENAAGANSVTLVTRVQLSILAGSAALTGPVFLGRTSATPSGGTAQTAQKLSSASDLPQSVVRVVPTATAASGRLSSHSCPGIENVLEVIELLQSGPYFTPISLGSGEGLILFASSSTLGQRFCVNLEWIEAG